MQIVMVGPFGLAPKQTMRLRALPIAQALVRRGHRVTLLLPPWSNPQASASFEELGGVRIVNLRLPPRLPGVFHLMLTLSLVRHTLALRPDVVHCFKPKAFAGLVAWSIWQLKRIEFTHARLVVDADDWEGAGGWNAIERYPAWLKRFFAWQENWGLRHADALTVASRALQTIAWSLGASRERVHYVPNGAHDLVPPSGSQQRTRRAAGDAGDPPTLLLYTRFFEFGLERIAGLFERIAKQEPGLEFVIVGKGLFGEDERFARLLTERCLGERVRWLGMLPAEDLVSAFADATLAIFPFDDTLLNRTKCSVKLTDLLTAGVPVVAESVGQNAEYIVHGASGMLVLSGDEDSFVAAIRQLLHDDGLRASLGVGAIRRMRDEFDWDRLAAEVEAAYRA